MKKTKTNAEHRKLMDRLVPDATLGRLLGVLATTYEMQPEFFETDFLPTLLGLGAWDDRNWSSRIALEKHLAELEAATVLLDARPYRGRPRSLRVEVEPVCLEPRRILHAKVLVGVYEEAVRLIVGSANLTEPGYRRNREVAAVLMASGKRPAEARLISDALREMDTLLGHWTTPSARQLYALALERLSEWATGASEREQWFVWGGGDEPLWRKVVDRWPSQDRIHRITVVSPFWSEERAQGPIRTLVTALRDGGHLAPQAELRLLTEAAPDKQTTYKPKLPLTFREFDAGAIGVDAAAYAVDPRVPPEEVGMGDEFTGSRSLHAKVVLLEGFETSLACFGSANFTRRGWGFVPNPRGANIEAALIVRRSGDTRGALRGLIPPTTGESIADRIAVFLEDLMAASGSLSARGSARFALYDATKLRDQQFVALVSGDTDAHSRERVFSGFNTPLLQVFRERDRDVTLIARPFAAAPAAFEGYRQEHHHPGNGKPEPPFLRCLLWVFRLVLLGVRHAHRGAVGQLDMTPLPEPSLGNRLFATVGHAGGQPLENRLGELGPGLAIPAAVLGTRLPTQGYQQHDDPRDRRQTRSLLLFVQGLRQKRPQGQRRREDLALFLGKMT